MSANNYNIIKVFHKIWNKRVIIFGFGRRGRVIGKNLPCDIAYYVDNDPEKWGLKFGSSIVHDPDKLQREDKEKIFIVVTSYYYKAIFWQLKEMGFSEDVHFINGLDIFGEILDKEVGLKENKTSYDPDKVWLRGNPRIEGKCVFVGNNVVLDDSRLIDTAMGRYSFVGRRCTIRNTEIGQFCSIGPEVMIGLERHPSRDFISTYPAFYMGKATGSPSFVHKQLFKDELPTHIGNDVWIAARAVILGGVNVGDGAIIGAGALVMKDVEPYSVFGGVPARLIRKRYSSEKIKQLLAFSWWNRDMEWIIKNAGLFSDEEKFFEFIKKQS